MRVFENRHDWLLTMPSMTRANNPLTGTRVHFAGCRLPVYQMGYVVCILHILTPFEIVSNYINDLRFFFAAKTARLKIDPAVFAATLQKLWELLSKKPMKLHYEISWVIY